MIVLKLIVLFLKNVVLKVSMKISRYFFSILSSFTMSIRRKTSESLCFRTITIKQDILAVIDLNVALSLTSCSFSIWSNQIVPLPKPEEWVFKKLFPN